MPETTSPPIETPGSPLGELDCKPRWTNPVCTMGSGDFAILEL